ncbi:MAG: tyrosine-type recombinase/integrase [Burkholderiales bacterium]
MAKGTVVVEVFKERLRLRWSYARKRYCIYIGLPDTKVNRVAAESKARQIELDMASDNFDPSLKKYKSEVHHPHPQLTVVKLFDQFRLQKCKWLSHRSIERYVTVLHYLKEYFNDRTAEQVNVVLAENFATWLGAKVEIKTLKDRLSLINSSWEWGIELDLVEVNPWTGMASRLKIPPKQQCKPFSTEEIQTIVKGFRESRYYSPYADFVEFLFGTGCRIGEAIGLRWGHVTPSCDSVWIGESFSRGVRKSTKTNRARTVTLTDRLENMLKQRKGENDRDQEDLVFTTPNGLPLDDHNFRNRAWKKVLTEKEIDYRKPYNTRHTLISHALDKGMNPVVVAQLTGHDVATLYENYAGSVASRPRLPDVLTCE